MSQSEPTDSHDRMPRAEREAGSEPENLLAAWNRFLATVTRDAGRDVRRVGNVQRRLMRRRR